MLEHGGDRCAIADVCVVKTGFKSEWCHIYPAN